VRARHDERSWSSTSSGFEPASRGNVIETPMSPRVKRDSYPRHFFADRSISSPIPISRLVKLERMYLLGKDGLLLGQRGDERRNVLKIREIIEVLVAELCYSWVGVVCCLELLSLRLLRLRGWRWRVVRPASWKGHDTFSRVIDQTFDPSLEPITRSSPS